MGAVNHVLITGAAGFIGRATVAEARARGIRVTALVRSQGRPEWAEDPEIWLCRFDLAQADPKALSAALDGVDAVIHAAAHLGGEAARHERDTLRGTETLLTAMAGQEVCTLVLVSSLAVYDTIAVPIGGTLTEDAPMEKADAARDAYVRGKLRQETLCRNAAKAQGLTLWCLRPGAVYGPGRLDNAHLGAGVGPVLLRVGGKGQIPLCHVGLCAWALVQSAVTPGGGTLNVLDDDLPDRARFLRARRRAGWPKFVIPVPWQLLMPMAQLFDRPSLPGLLRVPVLRARMTPLNYSNDAMRRALGGHETRDFEALMADAIGKDGAR
ncbi:NAD-dependent epimerase/dehydratase family protein [Thalassococcus sp. BH17M4-6]|uniref:NAD-dependent epimerase/dehydratase family protein n=1 Tax=Thalassococcus sp. BH17M4-6 TaxID=3413148 RepID=UPI003BDC986B